MGIRHPGQKTSPLLASVAAIDFYGLIKIQNKNTILIAGPRPRFDAALSALVPSRLSTAATAATGRGRLHAHVHEHEGDG